MMAILDPHAKGSGRYPPVVGTNVVGTPTAGSDPAAEGFSGWVVAAAVAVGLAGRGIAGVWFWAHPFNYSAWHVGLGVMVVGVCALVGLLVGAGRSNWVLVGSVALGGGMVAVTAVASGALAGVLGERRNRERWQKKKPRTSEPAEQKEKEKLPVNRPPAAVGAKSWRSAC